MFTQQDFDLFLGGYRSLHTERSFWIDSSQVIDGAIPADLEGTLLRNRPGLFEVGDTKIPQPFDGDGLVNIFAFKDGRAFFASRYVRTKGFAEEQAAGRLLYRGAFAVGNPAGGWFYNPLDLSVKGVANTGAVHWTGRLLALYERDLPYELSTPDLRTVGQTVQVPGDKPFFGAHYRVTSEPDGSRRLVAFNAYEALQDGKICVWEYSEGGERLALKEYTAPAAAFGFFHDLLVTDNYYVFLENPVELDLRKFFLKYMLGKACIAECLRFNPERKTRIHVIPRPGRPAASQGARVLETEPFFSFHHSNAWETDDGRLMIYTVAMAEGFDFSASTETASAAYYDTNVGRGALTRLVADPSTGAVEQHRLMARACEFPSVAPAVVGRPHAHQYLVAARCSRADRWGAPQVVVKVTADPGAKAAAQEAIYYPGRQQYCQEPIFVPRPNPQAEDDGYVMVLVYNAGNHRTRLDILDARTMRRVCAVALPHHLPLGLHGSWTGAYLGPTPGAEWAPTEYDIRNDPLRYE